MTFQTYYSIINGSCSCEILFIKNKKQAHLTTLGRRRGWGEGGSGSQRGLGVRAE
jgi:hypothetical protein